jgi:hypothetical protein
MAQLLAQGVAQERSPMHAESLPRGENESSYHSVRCLDTEEATSSILVSPTNKTPGHRPIFALTSIHDGLSVGYPIPLRTCERKRWSGRDAGSN